MFCFILTSYQETFSLECLKVINYFMEDPFLHQELTSSKIFDLSLNILQNIFVTMWHSSQTLVKMWCYYKMKLCKIDQFTCIQIKKSTAAILISPKIWHRQISVIFYRRLRLVFTSMQKRWGWGTKTCNHYCILKQKPWVSYCCIANMHNCLRLAKNNFPANCY